MVAFTPMVALFTDYGSFVFVFLINMSPGVLDIGKYARRSTKNFILNNHVVINRYVVLDFNSISNYRFRPDKNILSNSAVIPDLSTFHYMGKNAKLLYQYLCFHQHKMKDVS